VNRLGVDDDGTDWDVELMREAQRDPDLVRHLHEPRIHGAIRWTVLAVVGALVAACGCALALLAGV